MSTLVVRSSESIAANDNLKPIAGEQIEIAPFDGFLEVYIGGSASLTWTCTVGGRQVALTNQAEASAAFPTNLRDALAFSNEEVFAGERITLIISNGTGAAIVALFYIKLNTQQSR